MKVWLVHLGYLFSGGHIRDVMPSFCPELEVNWGELRWMTSLRHEPSCVPGSHNWLSLERGALAYVNICGARCILVFLRPRIEFHASLHHICFLIWLCSLWIPETLWLVMRQPPQNEVEQPKQFESINRLTDSMLPKGLWYILDHLGTYTAYTLEKSHWIV